MGEPENLGVHDFSIFGIRIIPYAWTWIYRITSKWHVFVLSKHYYFEKRHAIIQKMNLGILEPWNVKLWNFEILKYGNFVFATLWFRNFDFRVGGYVAMWLCCYVAMRLSRSPNPSEYFAPAFPPLVDVLSFSGARPAQTQSWTSKVHTHHHKSDKY